MSDILRDAAFAYNELMNYEYLFTLGNSKRQILLSLVSAVKKDFTHIIGLDHLSDIPEVTASGESQKIAVYKKILSGDITYRHIHPSKFLFSHLEETSSNGNESSFSIYDRIDIARDVNFYLDSAFNGGWLYKWDKNRSKIKIHNGRYRNCQIDAHYVLAIPHRSDPQKRMFFFFIVLTLSRPRMNPSNFTSFQLFQIIEI